MRTKEQYNLYHRIYRKLNAEKFRKYQREYNKEWRKKNGYYNEKKSKEKYPQKELARRKLQYAVRRGMILKQECCICGSTNSQAHHNDYYRPLEVIWVCPLHHRRLEEALNKVKSVTEEQIKNYKMSALKQKSQRSERTKKILEERKTGKSIVELGKIFGVSRQRVFQILKSYGDTLPKELSTEKDNKGIDTRL